MFGWFVCVWNWCLVKLGVGEACDEDSDLATSLASVPGLQRVYEGMRWFVNRPEIGEPELSTIPEYTVVVGGSVALRLYLGAHVPYSDLDVVCSCYAPDKNKQYNTVGLYNESATIRRIYEGLGKVCVKLSKDNIMRGPMYGAVQIFARWQAQVIRV